MQNQEYTLCDLKRIIDFEGRIMAYYLFETVFYTPILQSHFRALCIGQKADVIVSQKRMKIVRIHQLPAMTDLINTSHFTAFYEPTTLACGREKELVRMCLPP